MSKSSVENDRKEQILRSTSSVIARKGIKMLRVGDVAKEAGLSSGIIHYYFGRKATLIQAAFERNFEHSLERRTGILSSNVSAPKKLQELFDTYLPLAEDQETVEAWRVWFELWVEALHNPELQTLNEQTYETWRQIVASILEQGQREKTIRPGDPIQLANLLVGTLDGLSMQALVGPQKMTLEMMRETYRTLLVMISA